MKNLRIIIFVIALCSLTVFVGCKKDKIDSQDKSEVEYSFSVIEEDTCEVGSIYTPEITKTPADLEINIAVKDPEGIDVAVNNNAFKADKIGTYIIKVTSPKITSEKTITLNCVDGTAPVITKVPDDISEVELGKYDFSSDLSKIIATDNVDGNTLSKNIVSVADKDGNIENVFGNTFNFSKVGSYTINGKVGDSNGNNADFSYKITFKDSVKPVIEGNKIQYTVSKNGMVSVPLNLNVIDQSSDIKITYTVDGCEVTDGKFNALSGQFKITYIANDGFNNSAEFVVTLIVKRPGEIFNFETVDNVTNGLTHGEIGTPDYGKSDWGSGVINKDLKFVGSGKQSLRIDINGVNDVDENNKPLNERGQTFYDDSRIYGGEKDANTFSFYAYVEEDTIVQIYLMTGSGTTLKYNYSKPITLLKGGHTYNYYYTFDFDENYYSKHIVNIEEGLSGFAIKNLMDNKISVYLDDVCFMYSELSEAIELENNSIIMAETGEQVVVPTAVNKIPLNYFDLIVEVLNSDNKVIGKVDLREMTYLFAESGNYIFRYTAVDKLTKKQTILTCDVNVKKGKAFAYFKEELKEYSLSDKEIILPKIEKISFGEGTKLNVLYKYNGDLNKENEIFENNGVYSFTPLKAGIYTIILRVTEGETTSDKSYTLLVRNSGEIFNFETINGVTNGLTYGKEESGDYGSSDWGKVEINTDLKYVGSGAQSLKLTIDSNPDYKGQTFYDDARIYGAEKKSDTLTFFAYVDEDIEIKIYLMTGSGLSHTVKSNYSKVIKLKKGGHKYSYNFTKDFDSGYSTDIVEPENGLSGFTIINMGTKTAIVYLDDFCFVKEQENSIESNK